MLQKQLGFDFSIVADLDGGLSTLMDGWRWMPEDGEWKR